MKENPVSVSWWVYIVRCSDNSLYTGIATDVERRIAQHNEGKGARYTRGRRPVTLVYREPQPSRGAALSREARIKSLTRGAKESLIRDGEIRDSSLTSPSHILDPQDN
jgi:predicted GIY-YIG superfamily endonuclease